MTIKCSVTGCVNRFIKGNKTYSFHRFPIVNSKNNRHKQSVLLVKRRAAWLKAINNKSLVISTNCCVCSLHFHGGKPAHLFDEGHVDWVPTLFMNGVGQNKCDGEASIIEKEITDTEDSKNIHESIEDAVQEPSETNKDKANSLEFPSSDKRMLHDDDELQVEEEIPTNGNLNKEKTIKSRNNVLTKQTVDETNKQLKLTRSSVNGDDNHIQTDMTSSLENDNIKKEMNELKAQLARATQELLQQGEQLKDLKEKLSISIEEQRKLREGAKLINVVRENDAKTKFYTGLNTWSCFQIIFDLCEPAVVLHSKNSLNQCKLSLQEQLLLTLMRLRLNMNEEDLADRFDIAQSTVSRYISKWIDVMYVRLATNFMVRPARDELKLTMPMFFRKHFRHCVVIIDCFEVPYQNDLRDRCSTYSNYKSRSTVKFLIGITPQGTVSYISQAYGGRSSDVFITEDSKHIAVVDSDQNLLTNLLPRDAVLADRGFLIAEAVALKMTELITPAFKGTRSQLTQLEVDNSRKVSNVRIHVERVIGQLKRTFTFLKKTLTIDELRSDNDGLALIDKIAFVCCCLLNSNSGVIPSF